MNFFLRRQHPLSEPKNLSSATSIIECLQKMCAGNMTLRISLPESDPLFEAAALINQLCDQNTDKFKKISMDINTAVYSGLESGKALNLMATQFHSMVGTIDTVTNSVIEIAQSSNDLADSTSKTSEQTVIGRQSMTQTQDSFQKVSQETTKSQEHLVELTARVQELDRSTSRIDSLIAVIRGVSDQTNLLALNAAIEAARAGEAGRGFSVVAEEVRKLADQSRQSVGEITNQLTAIRTEVECIKNDFQNMDASFSTNTKAVAMANQQSINLLGVFNKMDEAIQKLAPIAQEQSATFEEISTAIQDMSINTANLNETTQLSNQNVFNMLTQLNTIRNEISTLQLGFRPDEILDLAKTDHLTWKANIHYMFKGLVTLDPGKIKNHSTCRLGKWYFGDGQKQFGHMERFKNLDAIHKKFHSICANAIELYLRKDQAGLQESVTDIENVSREVLSSLDQIKLLVRSPK